MVKILNGRSDIQDEFDAGIKRGLEDIATGRYKEVTPEYFSDLKARIKRSSKHSSTNYNSFKN